MEQYFSLSVMSVCVKERVCLFGKRNPFDHILGMDYGHALLTGVSKLYFERRSVTSAVG